MLRIFFLLFSVLFTHSVSIAQITNVVFVGSVSVNDGKDFPYKLFVSDSNDVLSGYSVMDIMGPDETKTAVKGSIDREQKQITFRETKIIYTKSKESDTAFCYLHARLKAGKMQGAKTLKGNFTGYKADRKTVCAKGKITLVCAQDALDKLMKIAEKEKIALPADTPEKAPMKTIVTHEREVDDSKITRVLPGKTIELSCPAPTVTLEIWDSKNIDGDNITLMQDSNALLDKYTISGMRKTLTVPMGTNKSVTLRLIANNEGADPVNTARIKVTSGTEAYYIDASTTIGNDVTIVLNRK